MKPTPEQRARMVLHRCDHVPATPWDNDAPDGACVACITEAIRSAVETDTEEIARHCADFAEAAEKEEVPSRNPDHRDGMVYAGLKLAEEIRTRSSSAPGVGAARKGETA